MPLKTWDTKADWDAAYSFGAEGDVGHPNTRDEVRLHYNRAVKKDDLADRASALARALSWVAPGPTIAIIGAGFGWTIEGLDVLGFTRVVGTDTSAYIQAVKATSEDADVDAAITAVGLNPTTGEGLTIKTRLIGKGGGAGNRTRTAKSLLNESGKTGSSRNNIKSALGLGTTDSVDWVVTESVLESLNDTEAGKSAAESNSLGTDVAHLVYTLQAGQLAGFNWKTLADWKTLIPGDTFIEAGTYRVL